MKKKYLFLFYGMLTIVLLFSVASVCCDSSNFALSPSNSFEGTWTTRYQGERIRLVINRNDWIMYPLDYDYLWYWDDEGEYEGTYTVSGDVATFFNTYGRCARGYLSGNSLTLYGTGEWAGIELIFTR